jgi:hypothetical protein
MIGHRPPIQVPFNLLFFYSIFNKSRNLQNAFVLDLADDLRNRYYASRIELLGRQNLRFIQCT